MRSWFKQSVIFLSPVLALGLLFSFAVYAPIQDRSQELRATQDALHNTNRSLRQRLSALTTDEAEVLRIAPDLDWGDSDLEQAGAAFQQEILTGLRGRDLEVLRYRQLTRPIADGLTRMNLDVELRGTLEGLMSFLAGARTAEKQYAISQLRIRALPEREQPSNATLVSATMLVWGLATEPGA